MTKVLWWIALLINMLLFIVSYGYKQFDVFYFACIAIAALAFIAIYCNRLR